jgi:CheY-like chemotaxis protein
VRKAQGAEFDLVLTDLGMPDMSGWEVVHRIHADTPELPVVLVTGWGSTISEEEAEHKPFEIRDLLHTTTTILSQSLSRGGERGEPDGRASA